VKTNRIGKHACQGCGISVGPGHIESRTYRVGEYQVCGWCRRSLERQGMLLMEPYNLHLFLHPDGEVTVEKSVFNTDEEED
jgi:hypothetical protein